MDKNNELANILRAELILLTKDILQNIHQKDLNSLYSATRQLQEKMAAIMVLKEQLDTSELMAILKIKKAEVLENIGLPVEKKKEGEPQVVKENIKNEERVNLKPETKQIETQQNTNEPETNPYKQAGKMRFVPKRQNKTTSDNQIPTSATPLKKMNIGLNDRIAFIKHLFVGDNDFYTYFVDRLNTFDNYEDALRYINREVKPQYNDWEGKDEYEFRLLQLLELRFA